MPPKVAQSSDSKRKSDNEPFSDSPSSYWPEGWSWARYSNPEVDFSTLSEGEKDKMRRGLQEVLGDDGMRRLVLYIQQKKQRAGGQEATRTGCPTARI